MTRAERFTRISEITPRAELDEAATGDRFLIVVEGSETEKRYLEDLCGKLNFSAYSVIIESPDTDPANLVTKAVALRDREKARADEGLTVAYNQVWVVCDRESKFHERKDRLQAACGSADANGVFLAISIPSFELWLLLHYRCHKATLEDCAAAEHELSDVHEQMALPAYSKTSFPLEVYVERECVRRACKYARSVREHHHGSDPINPARYWAKDFVSRPGGANAPDGNPSTDVDELVRQLNLSANPRFRFVPFGELSSVPFSR
jgi:hypothetical protein